MENYWRNTIVEKNWYQPIYCVFQSYCASLCHNYSRLFYCTFNIFSLLFRLIFYLSVNIQFVRLNISSDKLRFIRLIFRMSYNCCAIRSKKSNEVAGAVLWRCGKRSSRGAIHRRWILPSSGWAARWPESSGPQCTSENPRGPASFWPMLSIYELTTH